jgi:predicted transcriptional regulator
MTFRLTPAERHKLAELAKATQRSESAVLRALLRRARLGEPDLRLEADHAREAA